MKITLRAGLVSGLMPFFICMSAFAQMQDGLPDAYAKYRYSGIESATRSNRTAADEYVATSRTLTTDISVDENSYIVGPGDQFFIMFLNRSTFSYFGLVNTEGDLLVPSLGLFKVGKVTLLRAKELIREELRKKNKNDEPVYVTLSSVKNVTIFISGPVKYPGRFVVPGTMRLFDAVKIAGDPLLPLLNNLDGRSVVRASGDSSATFDVMRFIFKGDLTQNPYLYSGDCITIPGITRSALVLGAVSGPQIGGIPIKEGETVASLLSLFTFEGAADTASVMLKRSVTDTSETTISIPHSRFSEEPVRDHDVITVSNRSKYPDMLSVIVNGEVERPGYYPIIRNRTPVKEVLDRAGLLPTALQNRIAILRFNKTMASPQNPQDKNSFATTLPQSFSRTEMNNAISLMMTAKDYTIIRINDNNDVVLEKNDQIIVPRAERTVYISGAVGRPGGYEFAEGKTLPYYIDLAGGFNKFADKQNVYRMIKYGDYMQYSNDYNIEDGDVIVVPFSKENKFLNNVILPVFSILATSLSLLVAIISVTK